MAVDYSDIFQPGENGLPDLSKISVGQIFNGSVVASMQQMKMNYGIQEKPANVSEILYSVDPSTGRKVQERKATVVEDILNDGPARLRGHKKPESIRKSVSSYTEAPVNSDLPNGDPSDGDPSLLLPYDNSIPPPPPGDYSNGPAKPTGGLTGPLLEELRNLGFL